MRIKYAVRKQLIDVSDNNKPLIRIAAAAAAASHLVVITNSSTDYESHTTPLCKHSHKPLSQNVIRLIFIVLPANVVIFHTMFAYTNSTN